MEKYMKIIFSLFALVLTTYAASINPGLIDEHNATIHIEKIQATLQEHIPTEPEALNQYNMQRILLQKLQKIIATPASANLPVLDEKKLIKSKLSQSTILFYLNSVAAYRLSENHLKSRSDNYRKRLLSIKEHLANLIDDGKNDVLSLQLEYAYYTWKRRHVDVQIKEHTAFNEKAKQLFIKSIKTAHIQPEKIDKSISVFNKEIEKLRRQKIDDELKAERELIYVMQKSNFEETQDPSITNENFAQELMHRSEGRKYKGLIKKLNITSTKLTMALNNKLDQLFLMQIHSLKHNKIEAYTQTRQLMEREAKDLEPESLVTFKEKIDIVEWVKYSELGTIAAVTDDFEMWSQQQFDAIKAIILEPLFIINNKEVALYNIAAMIFTFIFGIFFGIFYKRRIYALKHRWPSLHLQSLKVMANIGFYIIIFISFIIALNMIGLDLSSISLVAGALSVGIGFGLKDIVANFISGIIIMFERAIRIGDYIELNSDMVGNVTDIRMRSTTIKTANGIDIIIPNVKLIEGSVINYTMEENTRRLKIPFSVAHKVAFEDVEHAILEALEASDIPYLRDEEHAPFLIITALEKSAVEYKLLIWIQEQGAAGMTPFYRIIFETLRQKGYEIPHQQMDIHLNRK